MTGPCFALRMSSANTLILLVERDELQAGLLGAYDAKEPVHEHIMRPARQMLRAVHQPEQRRQRITTRSSSYCCSACQGSGEMHAIAARQARRLQACCYSTAVARWRMGVSTTSTTMITTATTTMTKMANIQHILGYSAPSPPQFINLVMHSYKRHGYHHWCSRP